MSALPTGAEYYRRTESFTEASVPAGLLKAHSTKEGVWGIIQVSEGALLYRIVDPRRPAGETRLTPDSGPGVIEPSILHEVQPDGEVRFHVEFYREPDLS